MLVYVCKKNARQSRFIFANCSKTYFITINGVFGNYYNHFGAPARVKMDIHYRIATGNIMVSLVVLGFRLKYCVALLAIDREQMILLLKINYNTSLID